MLGSDSSHTDAYCELTNLGKSNISRNANVEILWGENFNETKEKAKKYNIKSVSKNLEDINFENIDLVMVVGRFGNSHFEPAKLAIENKKKLVKPKKMLLDGVPMAHFLLVDNRNKTLNRGNDYEQINKILSVDDRLRDLLHRIFRARHRVSDSLRALENLVIIPPFVRLIAKEMNLFEPILFDKL